MPREIDINRSGKPSLARKGVAALVLVAAALLVAHFVIGLITTVVTIVLVVAAIVAIIWAGNQLL